MREARLPFGIGMVLGLLLGAAAVVAWRVVGAEAAPGAAGAAEVAPKREPRSVADSAAVRAPATGGFQPAAPQPDAMAPSTSPELRVERESGDLISEALRDYAVAELRRGWAEARSDAMADDVLQRLRHDYEDQVRALPAMMGRRAAEEATVVERKANAFASADAVTLLGAIEDNEGDAKDFVATRRFVSLFDHRGGGSTVDGTAYRQGERLADGATLMFPAGVFKLGDLAHGNEPFPAEVTVRGASMDATLLVVDSLGARSAVDRLTIEDCTVFCDNGITDMRSKPAVLSMRRVRVVGFDCGAGGSCAFYLFGKSALLVKECRFEGGYGRAPGSYANLMDTRSLSLARFERCLFDRVALVDAGSTARFVNCEMRELLGEAPAAATYENCRITVMEEARRWSAEYRRRDLDALFPQWRERLQR